MHINIPWNLE